MDEDIQHGFIPELLISLIAPKYCTKSYKGTHYLGGRLVPFALIDKYKLRIPKFHDVDCIVKIETKDALLNMDSM